MLQGLRAEINRILDLRYFGVIESVLGLLVRVSGISNHVTIGTRCRIRKMDDTYVYAEVVGFREMDTLLMPLAPIMGLGIGMRVEVLSETLSIYPAKSWLGRVINGEGEPIDGKGPLALGAVDYLVRTKPLPSHSRKKVHYRLDLGVKAINTFTTVCHGQRMGIFAGSGVGKSVLMSQMARFSKTDVNVIGLIGERGREVREFIEDYLGEEGLARSVVIVATSDEPPLMRRQATQLTMAVAEYFRDQGQEVLCMIDSITRFAMAMREIGLAIGEPPTTKGYTPSVFAELPLLLERAGPGLEAREGNITGLFTVLVDGDDHNEPIADAVRGILDGHIVLDREIAQRGRFPPVDVLKSLSRTMPDCNSEEEGKLVREARKFIQIHEDMVDMIRLGAYKKGSDPSVDQAIDYYPKLEKFLYQGKSEKAGLNESFEELQSVFSK